MVEMGQYRENNTHNDCDNYICSKQLTYLNTSSVCYNTIKSHSKRTERQFKAMHKTQTRSLLANNKLSKYETFLLAISSRP